MQKEICKTYASIFTTPRGKTIIDDLTEYCEFTPNTQDSNDVFMRLGKQALLKYIKSMIERGKNE